MLLAGMLILKRPVLRVILIPEIANGFCGLLMIFWRSARVGRTLKDKRPCLFGIGAGG